MLGKNMSVLDYTSGHEGNSANGAVGDVCRYDEDLSDKAVEVAAFLLGERFYLSALEYYFEQLDRGKRISVLDHFFADANFFENISPRREEVQLPAVDHIGRFQSISTLDSIDIGRISDDGNSLEEKLKVVEYELRRKNEEIKSLRNELTALIVGRVADDVQPTLCSYALSGLCRGQLSAGPTTSPAVAPYSEYLQAAAATAVPSTSSASGGSGSGQCPSSVRDILPHELRALCVLVSEHLVQYNYRITAVQFAEESQAAVGLQDIDSWEEVGIDSPKPLSLLHLLRTYWDYPHACQSAVSFNNAAVPLCATNTTTVDVAVATDIVGAQSYTHEILLGYHNKTSELEAKEEQLRMVKAHTDRLELRTKQLVGENLKWRNQVICLHQELSEVTKRPAPINEAALSWSTSLDWSSTADMLSSHSYPDASVSSSQTLVTAEDNNRLVDTLNSRTPSPSLLAYLTNMLPEDRNEDFDGEFLLANSRDEFVRLVASHLEAILPTAPDDIKGLTLPLLTQVICLHPSASVRDSLICLLLSLFSDGLPPGVNARGPTGASGSRRRRKLRSKTNSNDNSSLNCPSPALGTSSREGWHSSMSFGVLRSSSPMGDRQRHQLLLLRACQRLASCIGPTRVESELLAQLWSQLNERPQPDASRRHLLVSACGVIAPFVPVHLQSSLVLSILESNLDEERDDRVRSASLRSLACLVCYITDRDKLAPLLQRLHSQLQALLPQLAPAPSGAGPYVWSTASSSLATAAGEGTPRCHQVVTVFDWLLPSLAQWCLEVDCLQSQLFDPWLRHLDAYRVPSSRPPAAVGGDVNHQQLLPPAPASSVSGYLQVLMHLIPFIYAWLLVTLVKPPPPATSSCASSSSTLWSLAFQSLSSTGAQRLETDVDKACSEAPPANVRPVHQQHHHHPDPSQEDGVTVRMILGDELYTYLLHKLDQALAEDFTKFDGRSGRSMDVSLDAASWPAKHWLQNCLLPRLVKLLENTPVSSSGTVDSGNNEMSLHDHAELFENFIRHHYGDHFACPWGEPISCEQTQISLAICRFLASFGASLPPKAVDRIVGICLQSKLMNLTEMGNLEFDYKALQTGLLAGYCCLLSSTDAKSDRNKVRTLLTNAIFLQTRESRSLDSVRLAIWCLCLTAGPARLESTLHEVLLPALRPCMACADSMVRRASASLLHSTVEALRFLVQSVGLPAAVSWCEHQLVQLVGQLARDDITGQRRQISPDEADWGVLAVSLGPLHSLLALVSSGQQQFLLQGQPAGTVQAQHLTTSAGVGDTAAGGPAAGTDSSETKLLELLGLLLNLVVLIDSSLDNGNPQSPKLDHRQLSPSSAVFGDHCLANNSGGQARLARTQHRFWTPLTHSLLQFVDNLLPSCVTSFRDQVLLPWLYHLADTNNSLPSLVQRSQLANHLFVVLSTATYVLQSEESLLLLWLVPALDRVRLDFVEASDTRRTHEVEQFIRDLYSRMKLTVVDSSNTKPKESGGLRNAVTSQLAKLTNRNAPSQANSSTSSITTSSTTTSGSGNPLSKRQSYRINLRRP